MIIHTGVPQDSVLSPSLFNFFFSDFSQVVESTLSYADYFIVSESSSDVDALGRKLTEHFEVISAWAKEKKLRVVPSKSQVILFLPNRHQANYQHQVFIDGTLVPSTKNLKILGITFDMRICF
jgi:hypothetical protein